MSNRIVPIAERGDTLVVAVADPFKPDPVARGGLPARTPGRALHHASRRDRAGAGAAVRPPASRCRRRRAATTGQASEDDVRRLEDMASEAPVIRLVQDLITRAVEAQASDIHVEPREDSVRVRYRIDGVLATRRDAAARRCARR